MDKAKSGKATETNEFGRLALKWRIGWLTWLVWTGWALGLGNAWSDTRDGRRTAVGREVGCN